MTRYVVVASPYMEDVEFTQVDAVNGLNALRKYSASVFEDEPDFLMGEDIRNDRVYGVFLLDDIISAAKRIGVPVPFNTDYVIR